eukprot:gene8053-biopygen2039
MHDPCINTEAKGDPCECAGGGADGVAHALRERGVEPLRPRAREVGELQRGRRRAGGELRRGLPLRPAGRDPRRAQRADLRGHSRRRHPAAPRAAAAARAE